MAYTPGTWTAQLGDNGIYSLHDAAGQHFGNFRPVAQETSAADNAALIAAAPELAEALIRLRDICDSSGRRIIGAEWWDSTGACAALDKAGIE